LLPLLVDAFVFNPLAEIVGLGRVWFSKAVLELLRELV